MRWAVRLIGILEHNICCGNCSWRRLCHFRCRWLLLVSHLRLAGPSGADMWQIRRGIRHRCDDYLLHLLRRLLGGHHLNIYIIRCGIIKFIAVRMQWH